MYNLASLLHRRTAFILQFFDRASEPFSTIQRKINAGEAPYIPPYSEDGEPPFLEEWQEAEESLDMLGQVGISMLAAAVHLYLSEVVQEFHRWGQEHLGRPEDNKTEMKKGWLNAHRLFFRERLGIDWSASGADLDLIEQVVLVRNRTQHPDDIGTTYVRPSAHDVKKHPTVFFADEFEREVSGEAQFDELFIPWRLNVTRDKLAKAIEEVQKLAAFIEAEWQRILTT